MDAVIVGGGIGGLAVAAGLHRRGWSVTVLEQTAEFAVVGAGISLWPNAFRALDAIGVALGDQRADAAGGLRDWRGRWIVRAGEDTTRAVVVHRNDLRNALLERVPAACQVAGARVSAVRIEGDRAVVAHEGGEVTADLVVGADGMNSAVRRSVWPAGPVPVYSGQSVWRAVLPMPAGLADTGHWAETWGPGSVFGMFPMAGDLLYCYGSGPAPEGTHSPDGELPELHRRFGDWCEPIPTVLAAAREEHVLRNDVFHLPPLPTYTKGPVVLVGDAAHAMTPNLGQGGCQALEDAATLGVALDAGFDVPTALRRYDAVRRPRTQAIARKALAARTLSHLTFAPARVARNVLLRALPTAVFDKSFTQPFDWRPEDGLVRT